MRRFFLLLAGAGCAAAATASDSIPNANHVVVTATRTPTPIDEVLALIVIDRATIERSVATDVTELLRFHAGLELGRNGGPGQPTAVFIRGAERPTRRIRTGAWRTGSASSGIRTSRCSASRASGSPRRGRSSSP